MSRRRRRKRSTPKGITKDPYGFRVYVFANGEQREKHFPRGTALRTMQAWRDETRVALRALPPARATAGTFAADVETYLVQVAAMPTIEQRRAHLTLWLTALGATRRRQTITSAEIRAVLQAWRAKGLGAATCNKRRTALMHLWSTLDGKGASNPVRNVPKFYVPDPTPRGRDPHTLDARLLKAPRCRSRACARVLLWTGMRPVELDRAEPDDLDLAHGLAVVRTGKRGRTRVVPLTPQAIAAWKEFIAEDAWHRVPKAAPFNRWLKTATGIPVLRVYDLRHTYGTALARGLTRLDVIGALMGHSTLELTRVYTLAAVAPDAQRATVILGDQSGRGRSGRKTGLKLA
jgi:integrase